MFAAEAHAHSTRTPTAASLTTCYCCVLAQPVGGSSPPATYEFNRYFRYLRSRKIRCTPGALLSRTTRRRHPRPLSQGYLEASLIRMLSGLRRGDVYVARVLARTVIVTRTPTFASMFTSVSMLNKSIRPRIRSLTRGWVTPSKRAARACVRP